MEQLRELRAESQSQTTRISELSAALNVIKAHLTDGNHEGRIKALEDDVRQLNFYFKIAFGLFGIGTPILVSIAGRLFDKYFWVAK